MGQRWFKTSINKSMNCFNKYYDDMYYLVVTIKVSILKNVIDKQAKKGILRFCNQNLKRCFFQVILCVCFRFFFNIDKKKGGEREQDGKK